MEVLGLASEARTVKEMEEAASKAKAVADEVKTAESELEIEKEELKKGTSEE